ncbi:hypothetical protein SAMN05428988_1328 [Chitinophaga sp. YR573]|uniref:hypothetical protein n=1 Tax=Chitinophaga sp. YR573 TaxID=1881040 RepID=UPI0008C5D925|nr:hypothetical protein [Chitinophaga sp. YR573]SEW02096.1 hypothetical protein SAMN05428988_1328 [Chitinophaga sp. YR573]
MLLSPNANLFESLIQRIEIEVPEIRYIDQDLGQLENYDKRPAVAFPCMLIDIDEFKYSDVAGSNHQIGEGLIQFRLGLVQYSNSNNIAPTNVRANALRYYELENKVYVALHSWAPVGFSRLSRRVNVTEKRDDDIRVRLSKYYISYTDTSAAPVRTTVPRPGIINLI